MIVMPGIMRGRLTSHDGALADFVNSSFYTKPGSNFANAQSMFTWSSSTKYTLNAAGVLVASGANTPAYEWNTSASPLGVLLEGADTNLMLQSQAIGTSPWSSGGSTVTQNTATAPDGTTTASRISGWSTVDGDIGPSQNITLSPTTVNGSIFVKGEGADIGKTMNLRMKRIGGTLVITDLSVTLTGTWQRVNTAHIMDGTNTGVTMILSGATASNQASGCLVWGAQVTTGAVMSSYIPTVAASVTRNADTVSRTLGTEWSATAGTILAVYSVPSIVSISSDRVIFSLDDGTANERFRYRIQSSQTDADFLVTDGGVAQADIDGPAISANTTVKAAMAWAANDFELVVNGASAGTDVSGTLPAVTTLNLGSGPSGATGFYGHIQRLEYWPSRLTQAQMQALTA